MLYAYGFNIGETNKVEVLRLHDPAAPLFDGRYKPILEVAEEWQAKAIAAILNAEIKPNG